MSRFNFDNLPMRGLVRIERKPIEDSRGFFVRMFCRDELNSHGLGGVIHQVNLTHTNKRGVVRGIHFQNPPHAETKLVSCIHGKVWDVVVDLRANSSTFLHWHSELLSDKNGRSLFIPEGFAHGFQSLTVDVEMIYMHSMRYEPTSEAGLNPIDPMLNIQWPLEITEMSLRDQAFPHLSPNFGGIVS